MRAIEEWLPNTSRESIRSTDREVTVGEGDGDMDCLYLVYSCQPPSFRIENRAEPSRRSLLARIRSAESGTHRSSDKYRDCLERHLSTRQPYTRRNERRATSPRA